METWENLMSFEENTSSATGIVYATLFYRYIQYVHVCTDVSIGMLKLYLAAEIIYLILQIAN